MIPTRPIEVLSVEDNPADARLIQMVFDSLATKTNLHFAADGEEALDYLYRRGKYSDATRPDFILLDLNLPKKHGREVLREIKSNDELKRIPVFIFTTSGAIEDVQSCYGLHANCYITKPQDLEQFGMVLKAIEQFWVNIAELPYFP
ncbi:response regulator [Candidatus Peregrinibacteria bacterium]|nr:response regulator [Candidatus Peregrinibacteria bacterium]